MKTYIYILITMLLSQIVISQTPANTEIIIKNIETIDNSNGNIITTEEEERLIFWIHGLGGDVDSWSSAAQWTDLKYKTRSLRPTYAPNDIMGAAAELSTKLIAQGVPVMNAMGIEDNNRNYIIAHSMGTAISRAMDKQYVENDVSESERMFGGMVFFNGFYDGAQISNSAEEGLFEEWAEVTCDALTLGPLLEKIDASWPLGLFIGDETVATIVTGSCDFIANTILPFISSGFNNTLTYDSKVDSPTMIGLNNYTSETKKVAFYAKEDEPVLWRTMSYLKTPPNDLPIFQANPDDDVLNLAESRRLHYQAKYDFWDAEINAFNSSSGSYYWYCYGWCSDKIYAGHEYGSRNGCALGCKSLLKDAVKLRNYYYYGKVWFETANDVFKSLTGALTIESHLESCWAYILNENGSIFDPLFIFQEINCNDCNNCLKYYTYDFVNQDTDGIVTTATQMNLPDGQTEGNLLEHTSHFQVRNNIALKSALLKVYLGNDYPFFRTNLK